MKIAPRPIAPAILLLALPGLAAGEPTRVTLQDFESIVAAPSVWVVNIPNQNATVRVVDEQPQAGKKCLRLDYKFVASDRYQYLGIPFKAGIQASISSLSYMLRGDGSRCSYGARITDANDETHQFSQNTGQGGLIDFRGWKEIVVDLTTGHESWGGDRNGKIDYPIREIVLTIGQPTDGSRPLAVEGRLGFDSICVTSGLSAEEMLGSQIAVSSPEYGAYVKGDVRVRLSAAGFGRSRRDAGSRGGGSAPTRPWRRWTSTPGAAASSSSMPTAIRTGRSLCASPESAGF